MDTVDSETVLVVTQRSTTTELHPLPTAGVLTLTVQGGLPGATGADGPQGERGQDGAAQIPDILDGGNF